MQDFRRRLEWQQTWAVTPDLRTQSARNRNAVPMPHRTFVALHHTIERCLFARWQMWHDIVDRYSQISLLTLVFVIFSN